MSSKIKRNFFTNHIAKYDIDQFQGNIQRSYLPFLSNEIGLRDSTRFVCGSGFDITGSCVNICVAVNNLEYCIYTMSYSNEEEDIRLQRTQVACEFNCVEFAFFDWLYNVLFIFVLTPQEGSNSLLSIYGLKIDQTQPNNVVKISKDIQPCVVLTYENNNIYDCNYNKEFRKFVIITRGFQYGFKKYQREVKNTLLDVISYDTNGDIICMRNDYRTDITDQIERIQGLSTSLLGCLKGQANWSNIYLDEFKNIYVYSFKNQMFFRHIVNGSEIKFIEYIEHHLIGEMVVYISNKSVITLLCMKHCFDEEENFGNFHVLYSDKIDLGTDPLTKDCVLCCEATICGVYLCICIKENVVVFNIEKCEVVSILSVSMPLFSCERLSGSLIVNWNGTEFFVGNIVTNTFQKCLKYEIYAIEDQDISLKHICRINILKSFTLKSLRKINLPKSMKKYLGVNTLDKI